MNRRNAVILVFLATKISMAFWPERVEAQGLEYVKAHYTKHEFRIPMRDGVRLFTSVYVPKDESKPYPILLNRTPYSVQPYGVDRSKPDLGPHPAFGTSGYIFAYQDVRGRWMSEGVFVNMRPIMVDVEKDAVDESTDTFDTIDWLVKNIPNNNGKVGQSGISYPGFYTASGLVESHPALKAASPQAPVTDWFVGDDFHHNGAFFLPHAFNFLSNFGRPRPYPTSKSVTPFDHGTPDGYEFFMRLGTLPNADARFFKGEVAFWDEMMRHESYDAFWQARNLRPHLKNVKPAVMTVGGWFDAENLFGALECYKQIESSSPNIQNTLVMGPWYHGQWGGSGNPGDRLGLVQFDSKTSDFYRESIELPFFEHHLKGGSDPGLPEALVFQTGTNRWRRLESWPPKEAKPNQLWLLPEGKLGFEQPSDSTEDDFDEYSSDPSKPVPYISDTAIGMTREYMVEDQRFAARRPDVLVYQTEPLEANLTFAGPIIPELIVSTSGTDSDWVVKIIDVYPDTASDPDPNPTGAKMGGFQQLLRGDVMRGKFRESYETPKPFNPGEPTFVRLKLNDVYHTFRTGHRIMVQIQSSWFPLVDRNPQSFVNIYEARTSDFRKTDQRVYRSKSRASKIGVLIEP
ncbi:CocE/NonD family hydrolase [Tundrisphaera lichenicola]|uniref:CocE/NonD family hydrolase n=1 Tax=Tundrisphaera lichenicola TaxID=2029860 RepID=UPI003EB7EC4A